MASSLRGPFWIHYTSTPILPPPYIEEHTQQAPKFTELAMWPHACGVRRMKILCGFCDTRAGVCKVQGLPTHATAGALNHPWASTGAGHCERLKPED